jgi:hypothetical protein
MGKGYRNLHIKAFKVTGLINTKVKPSNARETNSNRIYITVNLPMIYVGISDGQLNQKIELELQLLKRDL